MSQKPKSKNSVRKKKKPTNTGIQILPAVKVDTNPGNGSKTVRYRFSNTEADQLRGGLITMISMSLNSAMGDLDLPIGITIRKAGTGYEIIVEKTK